MTCLLTLLLVIAGQGQPSTYDNPRVYGDCMVRPHTLSIYISPYSGELVIAREFDIYYVEVPTKPGYYEFQYVFKSDHAYVHEKTEGELLPIGKCLVRRGPKGYY